MCIDNINMCELQKNIDTDRLESYINARLIIITIVKYKPNHDAVKSEIFHIVVYFKLVAGEKYHT